MPIIAKSKISTGAAYTLSGQQDIKVGANVVIKGDFCAIKASGTGGHLISVQGWVEGLDYAIVVDTPGPNVRIVLGENAVASSVNEQAIFSAANAATIVNQGTVIGVSGILFTGSGQNMVNNSGLIRGEIAGIDTFNGTSIKVINTGGIDGTDGSNIAIYGANLRDVIINKGWLMGDVSLGGGNDLYDGRGGKFVYSIDGGAGRDTFIPGKLIETMNGGDGYDTVDFRQSAGGVYGPRAFAVNGLPTIDEFVNFERVLGSLKGADLFSVGTGSSTAQSLIGFGGNDTLKGGAASDNIDGGLGRDELAGRGGADQFVYRNPGEGGDLISDFSVSFGDVIRVSAAGFGGGLTAGTLAGGRFVSGSANIAGDANDRFIFNINSEKLWFDRDGTGSKFAPVLIADLQNGANMTASDIVIF